MNQFALGVSGSALYLPKRSERRDQHLSSRENFELKREEALKEWRQLATQR